MREHIDFCHVYLKDFAHRKSGGAHIKGNLRISIEGNLSHLREDRRLVKHLLNDARNIMVDIFDHRCALINKNGVCHQCSHINEIFNPKHNQQEQLMNLDLVKGSKKYNRDKLFTLRTLLVKAIDPLHASGTDLHESIMNCVKTAIGEKSDFSAANRLKQNNDQLFDIEPGSSSKISNHTKV